MADTASPKRPTWLWPVVAGVVIVLAAGGFAAPSVMECSSSSDGFGACINSKLAGLGLVPDKTGESEPEQTAVAVAQPADSIESPAAATVPGDFGARVESDGSIIIAGSGAIGKTVQIFVNGELFGTATVEKSGDWVLVPEAPLPPGNYELTVVDPVTGSMLDKSVVVALSEDRTSEPLVVATTPGKASEIIQGLAEAASTATAVAEADLPEPAPIEETPAATEPAATEPAPETPEAATDEADTPVAEETPAETAVATAGEDVIGDIDAMQKRIEALAQTPPSIDAVEIDNGRNFFAGTGADGAIVRLYVDNAFVGDVEVVDGHWLLETGDVLKNRSQRVRADQLLTGSAEVASRAEIDFIFEEPQAAPAETAVAEAPLVVPEADFGIDTDEPVAVSSDTAEPAVAVAEAAPAAGTATSVAVPEPDFSIDTGIPVTIVPSLPADAVQVAGTTPEAEPAATEPEPEAAPVDEVEEQEPVAVATAETPAAAEAEIPQLVAVPVGRPELGRFATGKAIIRRGDNLWTIARRVYGSGYEYIQIYGANRDQIRNPNLIYPGQVFNLPETKTAVAQN